MSWNGGWRPGRCPHLPRSKEPGWASWTPLLQSAREPSAASGQRLPGGGRLPVSGPVGLPAAPAHIRQRHLGQGFHSGNETAGGRGKSPAGELPGIQRGCSSKKKSRAYSSTVPAKPPDGSVFTSRAAAATGSGHMPYRPGAEHPPVNAARHSPADGPRRQPWPPRAIAAGAPPVPARVCSSLPTS